jgi:hypothetical protein
MTGALLWGIGIALLAAAGVIGAASAWGDDAGALRTFWRDLRSGLHRRRSGQQPLHEDSAEPVDVTFAEIFAQDAEPEDGYLHLDDLADLLDRTGERAGRLLHASHRTHQD